MEIEVRILNIDVEEIRNKLLSNGGQLIKKQNQINNLFDFKDKRLLNDGSYIRIRLVEDKILGKNTYYITMKKRISGNDDKYKVMEEKEIEISNPIVGEEIFKSLGLEHNLSIKRYRESYKIFNTMVEIDINDENFKMNPYIEIEGDTKEDIEKTVKLLGYSMEDTTSKNIFDILKGK